MSTPFQEFSYRDDVFSSQGVSLAKIAKEVGTPAYVYSSEGFLKPLRALKKGLRGLDPEICFAVKANSNIEILKLLASEGAGMDVVSGGELYRAEMAGVSFKKVVFSGVGKTSEEISQALNYQKKGIHSFNIESRHELETLNRIAINQDKRAAIALRFNPDVNPKTHPYISTGLKKNKFGLNEQEVLAIVGGLDEFPGVDLRGISVHIGSQLLSLSPLEDAFRKVKSLIAKIEKQLRKPLSFVDLGGGIGISYRSDERPFALEKYCSMISKHFREEFRKRDSFKIFIEPGRVISGNAGVLLTQVLYRKTRSSKDWLVVDAGMNDLLRPALYGSYHEIVPVKKNGSETLKKTSVVGPVCESADNFTNGEFRLLPENLRQGDLLAVLSAGAYGFTMASNYNSRPRPVEVLVEKGSYRVIRRRETYHDLIRGEGK